MARANKSRTLHTAQLFLILSLNLCSLPSFQLFLFLLLSVAHFFDKRFKTAGLYSEKPTSNKVWRKQSIKNQRIQNQITMAYIYSFVFDFLKRSLSKACYSKTAILYYTKWCSENEKFGCLKLFSWTFFIDQFGQSGASWFILLF